MKPTHDIIDPELEARIVAWVLGEASPFEAAELERRCREQPELAGFKQHIQHTHELAAEAMRPATPRLRLNAARRENLLHTLRSPAPSVAADSPSFDKPVRTLPLRTPSTPRNAKQRMLRAASALLRTYGLAASVVLVIGVFLATRSGRNFVSDDRTEPQSAPLPHVFEAEKAQVRERAASLPSSKLDASSPVFPAPQPATRPRAISDADAAEAADWFEETLILAPFEVTTEADAGYTATNTLAGSRLRTELRDIASPFSTVKPERFNDAPPPPSPRFHEYTASSAVADGTNANDRTYGSIHFDPGFLNERAATNLTLAQPFFSATPGTEDLADVSAPARLRGLITVPDASTPVSDEVDSRLESVSTFSMHVSDVSFRLAQAALARGELPDAAQIRPEEFYNAFDYGDPAPTPGEKIACRIEQAAHPFLQQRNLVRIALRVPSTGRNATQPLRLTVLLDTSGSMERTDRAQAVQRALEVLASLLGPDDRVTLIGFARQPRLIAEALAGRQGQLRSDKRRRQIRPRRVRPSGNSATCMRAFATRKVAPWWNTRGPCRSKRAHDRLRTRRQPCSSPESRRCWLKPCVAGMLPPSTSAKSRRS